MKAHLNREEARDALTRRCLRCGAEPGSVCVSIRGTQLRPSETHIGRFTGRYLDRDKVKVNAPEVRRRRLESGLSLDALEHLSGYGRMTIWNIETGRTKNPTRGVVVALATVLGCSLRDLTLG